MDKAEELKIYEIGYLLVPYLPAENVAKAVEDSIKSKILASGGEVTSEIEPAMIRLAYFITKVINNKHTKFSDAYFGALRFKITSASAKSLQEIFDKDDSMIRYLLIALPDGSENIIVPKHTYNRREEKVPFEIERLAPEKVEEKPLLNSEELDKEIDKLTETLA